MTDPFVVTLENVGLLALAYMQMLGGAYQANMQYPVRKVLRRLVQRGTVQQLRKGTLLLRSQAPERQVELATSFEQFQAARANLLQAAPAGVPTATIEACRAGSGLILDMVSIPALDDTVRDDLRLLSSTLRALARAAAPGERDANDILRMRERLMLAPWDLPTRERLWELESDTSKPRGTGNDDLRL